jgi:hypothetical protein
MIRIKRFNESLELYDKVNKATDLYSDLLDRKDIDTYDLDIDIEEIVGIGNPDWFKLDEEIIDNLLIFLKNK